MQSVFTEYIARLVGAVQCRGDQSQPKFRAAFRGADRRWNSNPRRHRLLANSMELGTLAGAGDCHTRYSFALRRTLSAGPIVLCDSASATAG